MKSERRHELETNALAERLGSVIETGKPIGGLVLGGLALILVAALGYGAYSSWTHKANSDAWTEYYLMSGEGNGEAFNSVVELYPSSTAAPWARLAMADSQQARGIDSLYTNRATGEQMIGEAISSYKAVLDSTYEEELRYKASIGLAQCYESLGKLDDAIKQYEIVEKSFAPPAVATLARERIDWLKSEASKSFYSWFASLKPAPDAPPAIPSNLSIPPTAPDLNFPNKDALGVPISGGVNIKGETPTNATPADSQAKSSSGLGLELPPVPAGSPASAASPVPAVLPSIPDVPAPNSAPANAPLPSGNLPPSPAATAPPAIAPPAISPPAITPPAAAPPSAAGPAVESSPNPPSPVK